MIFMAHPWKREGMMPPMQHQFTLPDMSCGHCVAAITQALKAADGQAVVNVDLTHKTAEVDSALPREALAAALTEAGYPPSLALSSAPASGST
jgi:copper chaperone